MAAAKPLAKLWAAAPLRLAPRWGPLGALTQPHAALRQWPSQTLPARPRIPTGPIGGLSRSLWTSRTALSSEPAVAHPAPKLDAPPTAASPDAVREHVRRQYESYQRNTLAQLLPVETYRARYIFNPYPINFNIYYHYVITTGLRLANVCFRYFDRGLLELLGPYGLIKAFSYAAFKLELLITGYIPHYMFYSVATFFTVMLLMFSPLNVPPALILLFGYLFMAA